MKPLKAAAVLVAIAFGLSIWVGSRQAKAGTPTRISSSRLLAHGRARCTASVRSLVQVGHAVSVRFVFRNISKRSIKVRLDSGLLLKAADGTTYASSIPPLAGLPRPPTLPITVRPGSTKTWRVDVPVRWNGPLRVTPQCGPKWLPVLIVDVASPGPPADETTAVSEVVAASGHLLDQCSPQTPGVAVFGQISPPSGSAPPMSAECSVSIDSKGAFSVAQALVLIPPGLPAVTFEQPYEVFAPPYSVFSPPVILPPYEVIAWQLVVTRNGAVPVAAATVEASNSSSSGQMVPEFVWDGTAWRSAGAVSCGGQSWSWGTDPSIDFISVCPS